MERDIWLSAGYMKYHPDLDKTQLIIDEYWKLNICGSRFAPSLFWQVFEIWKSFLNIHYSIIWIDLQFIHV